MIDWQMIDEGYSRHFKNKAAGQEAYLYTVAFGSLYIQLRLGLTDRELIDQISGNPCMQYFISYKEFRDGKPFDASLLVTFRYLITLAVRMAVFYLEEKEAVRTLRRQ